jgi:hypothetical protein
MNRPRTSLNQDLLRQPVSDEIVLNAIFDELTFLVPTSLHDDLDELVPAIQNLPQGLRAMAATYQLDISMTLDDLGWHFANWHHKGYCAETSLGLRELEAGELAEIFDRALSITGHQWDVIDEKLAENFSAFESWYKTSELEATLMPLNRRWWDICGSNDNGIFKYWIAYARRYPDRVAP